MFRSLSEQYGWTPQQIGELTMPQAWMYLRKDGAAKKVVSVPYNEARHMCAARGHTI